MSIGYNNMNMYMYGNNGFGNLLQQGLNMFGGGYGMGNTSFFTNCYGEVNYDKMAGFQVANALLGTTFQMIASNKANKASEPEVNYTQELNAVAKEIKSKNNEWATKSDELETLGGEFKDPANKSKSVSTLQTELTKAEADVTNLTKELNELDKNDSNYATKKTEKEGKIKDAEEKVTKLKADIETKKKYEAKELEIAKVKDEIADLEKKQDSLQKAANEKTIEGHKSSPLLRARKECIDNWQDTPNENKKSASKAELEKAFHVFKKGGESVADKKKAAIAFTNMYKSLGDEKMINSFKSLNTAVQAWLDDYNKQHRQDVE